MASNLSYRYKNNSDNGYIKQFIIRHFGDCSLDLAKINGIVCINKDKIIGCILYSYYQRNNIKYRYVDALAVDKNYRAMGIGSALLNKVIESTNCPIRLSVDIKSKDKDKLLSYYGKKGFKEIGKNPLGNIRMERINHFSNINKK